MKDLGTRGAGRRRILFLLAAIVIAAAPAACAPQGVCTQHHEDVVGCGGQLDQIYRQIRTPSSPGG